MSQIHHLLTLKKETAHYSERHKAGTWSIDKKAIDKTSRNQKFGVLKVSNEEIHLNTLNVQILNIIYFENFKAS